VDERLVVYVRAQWAELVGHARELCAHADLGEVQELVLSTLTKVARRWRFVPDKDNPDLYVRQRLIRAGVDREKKFDADPATYQVMEVGMPDTLAPKPAAAKVATDPPRDQPAGLSADEAIAIVTRRVRRAHRSRLVAGGVAVVLVAAVTAVGLAGSGGRPARHLTPRHQVATLITFPRQPTDFAGDVTAGGGYIWTIESRATKHGSRSYVVQRDPVTGSVIRRYAVPEPDDHIAYGFGKAWAWHNHDDFPTTSIATVDGAGGIQSSRTTPPIAIQDATFTGNAAWFTEPQVNAVLQFSHGVLGAATSVSVSKPKFVVPLSPTSVLVGGGSDTLLALPSHRGYPLPDGPPTLLAPAPSYGFWVAHGRQMYYQSSISASRQLRLTLPLAIGAIIGGPAGGVYVALRSDDPLNHDPYLVYYSPTALAEAHPVPTAHLDGLAQAEGMVADPAGGIVFVTNEGAVDAWRPNGLPGSGAEGRDHADALG
jgi:hypothetical protein